MAASPEKSSLRLFAFSSPEQAFPEPPFFSSEMVSPEPPFLFLPLKSLKLMQC